MRALAVTISIGVFATSLALPALILAQDTAPAPAAQAPPEAAPPEAPPGEEAPPPADVPPVPEVAPPPEPAGGPATAPPAPDTKASASVSMLDFSFSPATVTVNIGDSVTWVNNGEEDHDAAARDGSFSTDTVEPGGSASVPFSSAGTFSYICNFHPDMTGTVVVSDPSGGTGQPTGTDGVDPVTGAPLSEEAAGALPGAAGSANGLPATGETEAPLLILGVGLFGCGALAAALARWRWRETTLWPAAF